MRLGGEEEEGDFEAEEAGVGLDGEGEAVEPGSSVDLTVLKAIDAKLYQQIFVVVSGEEEAVSSVVYCIEGEGEFGPEGSGGDFGDEETECVNAFGFVEIDELGVSVGGALF